MSELPVVAYSKRLEKYLNEYNIQNFCHSEFSDRKVIGQGGFAVVYSAIFQGTKYALKSLNNNIVLDNKAFKQIRNEIKSLYSDKINHPNVIKLYGFSRDPSTDNFMLILQYANGGDLRKHLKEKQKESIYKISWPELIKIAKEITSGLEHLHTNGIIHRDLAILKDEREKIIPGTPSDYANLYKKCWSSNPDQRPVLNEILTELEILSNLSIIFMINNIDVEDQYLSKDSVFSNYTNTNYDSSNNSSINRSNKNPNDDKQPTSMNKITKNSSSCKFCREKKVRCVYLNGGRCKRCINHNRECISDPQKKRGPKVPPKAAGSSTLYRTNLNFENLSNNEGTIFSGNSIGSSLATNDQSSLGISNVQISYSLVQSNPSNSDPISVNSTQETLPSRNFSAINNGQMLSPVIDNRQNFLRTRSPGTSRQPSPIRENRQRRREDRNHELGVGLHGNISNPNSSRSPNPIWLVSLYSDNRQQNLPISEITLRNFADLKAMSMPLA
ncbi:5453_t:CDS:2 [Dentiscutata erythropus]|uniref:5453_t:CDS:1 n=1 Tax=Dentiscutata erythropus TaxID=1348616 RepID=A0A9N8WN00_9GLOM|nr:5453_t:CDS:2 [Dentiscutata erythropus]